MDLIDYEHQDFRKKPVIRRPYSQLRLIYDHYEFLLYRKREGSVDWMLNQDGQQLTSPRCLKEQCIYQTIRNEKILNRLPRQPILSKFYRNLLTEAIFLQEINSIRYLVAIWPSSSLKVVDILPTEDEITSDYMTRPLERSDGISLLDCFIVGLLCRTAFSQLEFLDFTGFESDKRLSRELCRLPILWFHPENRIVEIIHDYLSPHVGISKDKVTRFVNRISVIYQNIDQECAHAERNNAPLTIHFDCKVTIDDVPLGLVLQQYTPFRFTCSRLWFETIPDLHLPLCNLAKLINFKIVTSAKLSCSLPNIASAYRVREGLTQLLYVRCLNLHLRSSPEFSSSVTRLLRQALSQLPHLCSLSLVGTDCHDNVGLLLSDLKHDLIRLDLSDCRLTRNDLVFLGGWSHLSSLRDLVLSRNSLRLSLDLFISIIHRAPCLVCLQASYCLLNSEQLLSIVRELRELAHIKRVSLQSFTPPAFGELVDLVHTATSIVSLQRIQLLPDGLYAFIGNNDAERIAARSRFIQFCCDCAEMYNRADILTW